MLKKAGYVFTVCAIATLAIAWSDAQSPQQSTSKVETISPESLTVGHGPLPETKFSDMTFVFN